MYACVYVCVMGMYVAPVLALGRAGCGPDRPINGGLQTADSRWESGQGRLTGRHTCVPPIRGVPSHTPDSRHRETGSPYGQTESVLAM